MAPAMAGSRGMALTRIQACKVAGTGLEHDTGRKPMGSHQVQSRRATMVQIQQDIARVTRSGVGLNVYITALAVAHAQKSYGRFPDQLRSEERRFPDQL